MTVLCLTCFCSFSVQIVVIDSNLSIQFLQPVPYETVCVDIEGRTVAVGTSVSVQPFIFPSLCLFIH